VWFTFLIQNFLIPYKSGDLHPQSLPQKKQMSCCWS